MSLVTQLNSLVTRIGTEFKSVRTSIGALGSLTTTDKTSIVAAINEVQAEVSGGGATINDSATATTSVWSSQKTSDEIGTAVAGLVASAPTALNTLDELAAALGDDANFSTTVTTALGNRVRVDAAQGLNSTQQGQARSNIAAAGTADMGDHTTDFVAGFEAALL